MSRFDHDLIPNLGNIHTNAQVVLIDVDGCLLDNEPRLHHICELVDGHIQYKPAERSDWKAYEKEAPNDKAMRLCKLLKRLTYVYDLVFLTARTDDDFQVNAFVRAIQPYIGANGNWYFQFKGTPPGKESAVDYKRRIVQMLKAQRIDIVLAIDDSLTNIEMFKEEGICALRCHDNINETNMDY